MFEVTKFMSNINRHHGLAMATHFNVNIPIVSGIPAENINTEALSLMCKSAKLPGINLLTSEISHAGYGAVEKRPYRTGFNDAQFDFYLDSENHLSQYFDAWMKKIANFTPDGANESQRDTFDYPSTYWVDITVNQYDETEKKTKSYTLIDAYPTNIGEVSLDWDTGNPILLPVNFTYTTWTTNKLSGK